VQLGERRQGKTHGAGHRTAAWHSDLPRDPPRRARARLRAFLAELIPVDWLKRFQSNLRLEIAERLALPNQRQMWELPRDDGGLPLQLYKGKTRTKQQFAANETSDVTRDAQGCCNPPRDSYDRPQIAVIIMGDSFTLCVAVAPDASWMSRIGQLGRRRHRRSKYAIADSRAEPPWQGRLR
jgi:hypothetical protein